MSSKRRKKALGNRIDISLWSIAFVGLALRLINVFNTTVFERSHDVGVYTSLTDGQINPGHLGYIEYIVKFGTLPQIDPFSLFSYYHPPLYYLLGAMMVKLSLLFGDSYENAFENVQFISVIFSMLTIFMAVKIFRLISNNERMMLFGVAILSFHPAMIFSSAWVNNDVITLFFQTLIIYFGIRWGRSYRFKDLIYVALCMGLGMCTKLSVAMLAPPFALVMLIHFISEIREGRGMRTFKQYLMFGVVSGTLGLSWSIRNLIKFHTKPGISSYNPGDIKYMGPLNMWERFGWPADWGMDYPFHNLYGNVSKNAWLIMLRTSIFAETRPDVKGASLLASQIAFILIAVLFWGLTIWTLIALGRKAFRNNCNLFIFTGFLTVFLSYMAFVIKYPYTCSCDFRYIMIVLVFWGIGLLDVKKSHEL